MTTPLIWFLILCASLLEVLLSSYDTVWGLGFSLASFGLAAVDTCLLLLAISLVALHIFFVSVQRLRDLSYTEESRKRQGFIEAQYLAHELYLRQSLKSLS